MLKRPLYILVLEDQTIFQGGTYQDTKWKEIPHDKKIKRIFYSLPHKDFICLEGYDQYYHMIEATTDMSGKEAGKSQLEYSFIMGKKEDKITVYKISLCFTGNKKVGDVERIEYNETDSFIKGLNPSSWR